MAFGVMIEPLHSSNPDESDGQSFSLLFVWHHYDASLTYVRNSSLINP